jgi:HAD superfamily hydrolase (TIGR01457 family)
MTTLLDRHDLLLADLDGTLYQGRAAIPGAVEAVRAAADRGVRTLYVTNNAARSAGDVAVHLAELGYPAGADDVATSSQAAAALLAEQLSDGAKVLVVGTPALAAEITAVGLTPVDSADGATAVVQGLDPQLRYATLAEACIALRAGAVWVACNVDPTLPSERGPLPGNGSLVAVLRTATRLEPQVAGKPAPALMQTAARRVGASAPLVVGDRLDTDIQGGRAAEMATLLVLTGVSDATELLAAPAEARPDYVGADLGALDLDPDTLAVGPRPGWTVDGGPDGLVLSGSGDPLDALRTLCVRHWDTGGGPPHVRADGADAAAALRALGLTSAPGGTTSATVAGAETDPRSS